MTADGQDVHFVVFAVEGQRHAIDLRRVARVVHAVAIAPLPGAPAVVDGVVNVHGSLVPAVNMRRRLGLPPRPVRLADHFLLVATAHLQLLLMTDAVRDVLPLSRQLVKGATSPLGDFVDAVVQVEDGVIMIDDVDRLLPPAELTQLQRALGDAEKGDGVTRIDEGLLVAASDAIREHLGLSFRRERWRDLEAGLRIAAPALGLEDAAACARWVAQRPLAEAQLKLLAQSLTVGETYFCRDGGVFRALEKEILPPLVAARRATEKRLRIWSAACCTGEEPYTIAMILRRVIPDLESWNLTLLATDLNGHSLAKAAQGIYGEWSFRRTPMWMRKRHFRALDGGRWAIDDDIRRLVTFDYLNLADATYPALLSNTNAMDVVFCRNVLMYFDAPLVAAVGQRLQSSLLDGGWLAVGRSEALAPEGGLAPLTVGGERWYRKEAAAPHRAPADVRVHDSASAGAPAAAPVAFPLAAERLCAAGDYAAAGAALRAFLSANPGRGAERRQAMRLLAHACANLGRLEEAQDWCEKAIAENKLDARLHYLLASVLLERDRSADAEASLRHALAVDETFVLAHFTLGNLARRSAGRRLAREHYERTLALLRCYRPDDILPESEGMTARNLSEIATLALAQC